MSAPAWERLNRAALVACDYVVMPLGADLYSLQGLRNLLMPLAQDARKPMFLLKPADGAIGGHSEAVLDCYRDFKALATKIATACGVAIPAGPTQTR